MVFNQFCPDSLSSTGLLLTVLSIGLYANKKELITVYLIRYIQVEQWALSH